MTDKWIDPCACLGPMNGEPHCHCVMERNGIPRSEAHKAEQDRIDRELPALMDEIFSRRFEKREKS